MSPFGHALGQKRPAAARSGTPDPVILCRHKPPGWTPLEVLDALRRELPILAEEPMVYAGRLDPMAEGLLLVLTGADRHAAPAHLLHDKEYVATFLFGVRSDTHDALGRLSWGAPAPGLDACLEGVAGLVGPHDLCLPAWSAYRVHGRPLHAWAHEGRLAEIVVPRRVMTVRSVAEVSGGPVDAAALLPDVSARIDRVRGRFRQAEAREDWLRLVGASPPLVEVRATLTVSSGTYVRALAEDLGRRSGCGALLFALRRTGIGAYRDLTDHDGLHNRDGFSATRGASDD